MSRPVKFTTDDCVGALVSAASVSGEKLSRPQYDELGLSPSVSTISRKLGGWNSGKRAAGLPENAEKNRWDDESIECALMTAKETLGPSFSKAEYAELQLGPSARTIARRHEDGWLGALDEYGIEGDTESLHSYSDGEALQAVVELTLQNDGVSPGVTEYRESEARPSYNTLTKKFDGGWADIRELAELCVELYQSQDVEVPLDTFCMEFCETARSIRTGKQ